jgi:hypothetical protein
MAEYAPPFFFVESEPGQSEIPLLNYGNVVRCVSGGDVGQ